MKNNMNLMMLLFAGVVVYYFVQSKKPKKSDYARQIVAKGNSCCFDVIMGFDEDFLKVWAMASNMGSPQFLYKGGIYSTMGGRVKK